MESQLKTQSDILESLNRRYATKQFDPSKKISPGDWQVLEDTLRLTPSSFGMQPYKFVVVTDQTVKDKLVSACWNQAQVTQCSHFVIFARNINITLSSVDKFVDLIATTRKTSIESLKPLHGMISGFIAGSTPEKLADWAALQIYIALGNLVTVAAMLKIDDCPMEGIIPSEVDRILRLNEKGCSSVVACALGYRASDDKYAAMTKVRFSSEELFIRV